MDFWQFYIPIFIMCIAHIIYEIRRKQPEKIKRRGLTAVLVCTVMLPLAGIICGISAVNLFYAHLQGAAFLFVTLLALAIVIALTIFVQILLMTWLRSPRIYRIFASICMFISYLGELSVLGWALALSI